MPQNRFIPPQQRQDGSPSPSRARGSRGLSLHQFRLLNREFDSTGNMGEPGRHSVKSAIIVLLKPV
jgi:hypothetical protein